jgi:preprotein translocase subunit YajC
MQPIGTLIYLAVLIAIFYFLIIRPQQKRAKDHQDLMNSIQKGDRIVTAGGIHGTIVEVKDETVILNIASQVDIELSKQAIVSRSS